ncbi:hypothetical protein ONZ45_g15905 [Pleurotus djamor]|nr:hypothetical protein ONZ45_g15905 [Pleurotus djamor]
MPPPTGFGFTNSLGVGSGALPTPQLSSGPSSGGSSPRSVNHALPIPTSLQTSGLGKEMERDPQSGSGTLSASSSRAPSPHLFLGRDREPAINGGSGHHHLAHSVRLAFGMTPIHPHSGSRSTAYPSSGVSTPNFSFGSGPSSSSVHNLFSFGRSVPVSRSGSPPITLPPLKIAASAASSPTLKSLHALRETDSKTSLASPVPGEECVLGEIADTSASGEIEVAKESGDGEGKNAPVNPDGEATKHSDDANTDAVLKTQEKKISSKDVDGDVDMDQEGISPPGAEREKIELPGFSQFEAAARVPLPTDISAVQHLHIASQ